MELRKKMMLLLGVMLKKIMLLGDPLTLNHQMSRDNQEAVIGQTEHALTAIKKVTTRETALSQRNQDHALIASKRATWRENVQSLKNHEKLEKAMMTEKPRPCFNKEELEKEIVQSEYLFQALKSHY